jgi:hypothetical protein
MVSVMRQCIEVLYDHRSVHQSRDGRAPHEVCFGVHDGGLTIADWAASPAFGARLRFGSGPLIGRSVKESRADTREIRIF